MAARTVEKVKEHEVTMKPYRFDGSDYDTTTPFLRHLKKVYTFG